MKKIFLVAFIIPMLSFSQSHLDTALHEMRNFAVKFCPTQIVAGEINFSYEQRIARKISLELEIGPTISQFGLSLGNQRLWQNMIFNQDYKPVISNSQMATGFHVAFAPKFFPLSRYDYLLQGFYISPQFKYRMYNYVLKDYTDQLGDDRGRVTQSFFRFNMGFNIWPKQSNFCIDVFWGLGMNMYKVAGKAILYTVDGNGNETYSWKSYNSSGARFNFLVGVKFGYGK